MNDLEALIGTLLGGAARNAPDAKKISELANRPESRKVLSSLSDSGAQTLQRAAQYALSGDMQSAKRAFGELMATKDGAAFANALKDLMKGR